MPDHSLPTWAVHGTHADVQEHCENQCTGTSISFMKYDLENIPDDFLQDPQTKLLIEEQSARLDGAACSQDLVQDVYKTFIDTLKSEMCQKLRSYVFNPGNDKPSKRVCKPWWSSELSTQWNSVRQAEKVWLKDN